MSGGDAAGAVTVLDRSLALYPTQVASLINMGISLQRMGQFARGVTMFDRAVREHPLSAKAHGYRGFCLQSWAVPAGAEARTFMQDSQAKILLKRAAESLDRAMELGWAPPSLLLSRASIAIDQKDFQLSEQLLQLALRENRELTSRDPSIPVQDTVHEEFIWNQLAITFQAQGKILEAEAAFESGVTSTGNPRYEILANYGSFLHNERKYGKAKEVLNKCLVFPFPAPSAAYNTLGLIARDLGDLKEALGYFEKAIEGVSPQHPFWGVITGNIDITKDMMKTLH